MKRKKKIIISLIITVVVLGIAAGVLHFIKNKKQKSKVADVYAVSELGYDSDMMGYGSYYGGMVTMDMEQKIYVSSSQKISEICVEEGQRVKAGQVLMRYDTTSQKLQLDLMRADVEIARAELVVAQSELKKLENTVPVPEVPEEPSTEDVTTEEPSTEDTTTEEVNSETDAEEELNSETDAEKEDDTKDDAEADNTEENIQDDEAEGENTEEDILDDGEITYTKEELEKAIKEKKSEIRDLDVQYQLKLVELQIMEYQSNNGEVYANFDGVVKALSDEETAAVNNEPVMVVSGNGGYTVESSIGELALMSVKAGDTVSMFCYDNGMEYQGIITEISDIPGEENGSYSSIKQSYYPVTIAITDGEDLYHGMYMEITINNEDEDEGSFYIPLAYVRKENGNYYVMKDVDGKLKKQYVKTGKIIWGDTIEIKSGITMEDYVAFPYAKDAVEGVKTKQSSMYDMMGMYY